MKTIYKAGNITEAHIVAGMLEARGIQNHVGGHYLQGGAGEIGSIDLARVFVADEDYEAALSVITEYEASQPTYDPEDTPSASGVCFAKPVLFWGFIILLILLFLW